MADPVVFALAPALVDGDIINYGTSEGSKLYKSAIAELPTQFDLKPENLTLFLDQFQDRAAQHGWGTVTTVPTGEDLDIEGETVDIITEYGMVTILQIMDHAATYIDYECRAAQDNATVYLCIMNSLTKDAQKVVRLKSAKYTLEGAKIGAALLKVVVGMAHVDTRATVNQIRASLGNLDKYMIKVQSNVEKFNQHVDTQVQALAARGQTSDDLLVNLFKGYSYSADETFKDYISKKEDAFEEGQDIDPSQLMDYALNKYRVLVEKGTWSEPSAAQEKIVALEATLTKMRQAAGMAGNNNANRASTASGSNRPGKEAWKLIRPTTDEAKDKTVDGKLWHWCENHVSWVRHLPSECNGKGWKPNRTETAAAEKATDKMSTIRKALAAVVTAEEDEPEDTASTHG